MAANQSMTPSHKVASLDALTSVIVTNAADFFPVTVCRENVNRATGSLSKFPGVPR